MKITLTTGIFPPDIGGPASFIPLLAEKLLEYNIEIDVITLSNEVEDYSKYPYKVTAISRKIKKPFRDYFVIKEIINSAKTSDFIFSNTLAFESAIASKILNKPLIQKIVGDIAWERANSSGRFIATLDEYQKANLCLKSKLTNIYRNFAVNASDVIVTPSYYLANIVKNWGYQKDIKVIYNSVEFSKPTKKIVKDKFRIITVARLIPHKGIEAIIDTLKTLEIDFEYIIIGDGPLRNKLEKASKDMNVKFLGNISKQEVANWLFCSDLFILNSSYEGLPHVVLESMYNECCVIASDVGGTPEVVKHMENGILFEYNNKDELKQNILKIYNNESLRKYLLNNAKQFVQKFGNVNKMIKQYIDLFKGLN